MITRLITARVYLTDIIGLPIDSESICLHNPRFTQVHRGFFSLQLCNTSINDKCCSPYVFSKCYIITFTDWILSTPQSTSVHYRQPLASCIHCLPHPAPYDLSGAIEAPSRWDHTHASSCYHGSLSINGCLQTHLRPFGPPVHLRPAFGTPLRYRSATPIDP